MTFSVKAKNEILSANYDGNEIAVLCGVILSCGSIIISNKQMSFTITTENYDILKFTKKIIEKLYPHAQIELTGSKKNLGKRVSLFIDPESANQILKDCGIICLDEYGRTNISLVGDQHLLIEKEGKIAYLAGMFLGAGSISIPTSKNQEKTGGYHMEWSFSSGNQADIVCELLSNLDVFAKIVMRGENYVVYIKGSEQIGTILATLGASESYLDIENEIVSRQMRNLINRQSNCISANIDKTVNAGLKQLEAINLIDSIISIDSLPQSLREIAKIRIEHPEASLQDIVELLDGKITKSAVNLRFRKLIQIAKELGETND